MMQFNGLEIGILRALQEEQREQIEMAVGSGSAVSACPENVGEVSAPASVQARHCGRPCTKEG